MTINGPDEPAYFNAPDPVETDPPSPPVRSKRFASAALISGAVMIVGVVITYFDRHNRLGVGLAYLGMAGIALFVGIDLVTDIRKVVRRRRGGHRR